jgi:hypothetical protein
MAYIVPSPLVYQQLESTGGVLNSTPDLDTCIIGPAYNILSYDGTVAGQVRTVAISTTTTTGTTTAASFDITSVASPGSFSVGDTITVIGAGDSGSNLRAVIVTIAGNKFTLDTAAVTAVTGAVISRVGQITNPTITNTFALPGQKPGQVVTVSSVVPWLSNTKVETALTGTYGRSNNNLLVINTPASVTGSITAATTTLTITTAAMATQWAVGDVVSITNAGAGGTTPHVATITNIAGTAFTVTPAAVSTANTQAVAKVLVSNLNSTTNTLRAEAGDDVKITYTTVQGVNTTFTSKIKDVVTTSGANGTLVNLTINDVLPDDFSTVATTGTVGAASSALTVASGTGLNNSDTVQVFGAGAGGIVLETTVASGGGTVNITLTATATTAVTAAKVVKVLRTNGTINAGSTSVQLITGAATVFAVGDRVLIVGAGAGGQGHIATITVVSAPNITIDVPTVTQVSSATVKKINNFQLSVRKTYNHQQVATTRPIAGGANFDTSNTQTNGQVTINANPELVYGKVMSADVYFAYKALRTDLSGTINTFENIDDVSGTLGVISDANPLALGIQLALANTTGRIFGIGVATDDLAGHQAALALTESQRLYTLVPLTQDTSILAAYKAHVDQTSLPAAANWRIVLTNTLIPLTQSIGQFSSGFVNSNGGNNAITLTGTDYTLTASNATFISDGLVAGDNIQITASTPGTQVGAHKVLTVVSNQQVIIEATATATAVSYYATRNLTKSQQATAVAATSTTFSDKRVIHIQPDIVGVTVNGVVTYLPGYYLCAAIGGMVSGFPVQMGFTNVGLAGISDLKHSNYYFSKADLNTMAEKGTFLIVQATQGGIPYVRHQLTTDVSVLEFRELLVVKNWDFLSYYFYDKMAPFIGQWNITKETLNTIRQSLVASAEQLLTRKLPKIGAPLLSYNIRKLEQDANNKDNVNCELLISVVYPLNYLNLFLII